MTARILDVFINGRLAGKLVENRDVWGFAYEEEWMGDPRAFPLAPGIYFLGKAQAHRRIYAPQRPMVLRQPAARGSTAQCDQQRAGGE
ncbi:HipA N-terminal domain-containing protein [Delftia tsuruhatensis]|uniref:HipA N-terminal domain-containing protein n=1 Tax=Delftia tsuruhatensis TaxID=180282 RepID=UPI000AFA2431|nr:HipA N-terminal domain-containing protein [Delftia tsuruhatensis]